MRQHRKIPSEISQLERIIHPDLFIPRIAAYLTQVIGPIVLTFAVAIAVPVLTSNLPLIFKDWILESIPVLTIVWFIAFYFVNLKGTLHDIVAKDLGKVPETGIDVTVSNPEEKSDLAKNNLPDAGG